jgi:hypothetical protein
MPSPQPDQVAAEPVEVAGVPVAALELVPADQQLGPVRVVGPPPVGQELLAHEQHRDPRGGEQQPGGNPSPAARVPGPGIVPVGELGNAGMAMVPVGVQHQVMVLKGVVGLPGEGHLLRALQPGAELAHVDAGLGAARGLAEHGPDPPAEQVGVAQMEPHPVGG